MPTSPTPDPPYGEYPLLRITERCLVEDLGLSADLARRPVEEVDHELARVFVERRAEGRQGSERFRLPKSGPIAEKLRWTDRWRGATWYDRYHNIIWLIGAGWHEEGSRDDVYVRISVLDNEGRLFPTEADRSYVDKIRSELLIKDLLFDTVPALLSEAHRAAPAEVFAIIGGTIPLSLAIEAIDRQYEVVWAAISFRWRSGGFDPPQSFVAMLLAAIYPGVDDPYANMEDKFLNRERRSDEQVFACLVDRSLYG